MAYVEQSEMTDYLRNTVVADEADIQAAILVAESTVNDYCRRVFTVPTAGTTRSFVADDPCVATVPDIANVTDLVIVDNGSTLSASQFQLEVSPGVTSAVGFDGRTRPYTLIRRMSGWWNIDTRGNDTLVITARWGWAAIPPEVPQATKLIARDILLARDTGFGVIQVGMAQILLEPLRRSEAYV